MADHDDLRGSAPMVTTKDLLNQLVMDVREVRDYVVAEKAQDIPKRVVALEKWQRWVVGFCAGILAFQTVQGVFTYVIPGVAQAFSGR